MLVRATRRYDEIGKTVFRIYDPVDIYAALQEVSAMKPLVKDPTHEVVFDQRFVNRAFAQDGGAKRLNSLLWGDLDQVLDTLSENLWQAIA